MTQTTATRESGPDDGASPPRKRRLLPKILIGVAVLLVAAIGAGLIYAATIDRSLTKNLTRGVELPADESSIRPPRKLRRPAR